MANDSNFVLSQELPSGPDNDIIGNGLSSGNPMYDLSDSANQQTWTPSDTNLTRPGSAVDSNNSALLQNRQEQLVLLRGANPFVPIYMLPNSACVVVLAATVAQNLPIPAGAKYVVFKGTGDFWLSRNGGAQVPAATDTSGGAPILNPTDRAFYVEELQDVSLVAAANCIVSAQFYFQQ